MCVRALLRGGLHSIPSSEASGCCPGSWARAGSQVLAADKVKCRLPCARADQVLASTLSSYTQVWAGMACALLRDPDGQILQNKGSGLVIVNQLTLICSPSGNFTHRPLLSIMEVGVPTRAQVLTGFARKPTWLGPLCDR